MKIGFFDSGIGGLTVLREALKVMPNESYIYYADTSHVPYGVKPKEEAKRYIFEAVNFMVEQGIKALVIACNTATIIAVNDLRKKYSFPIVGIEPAVKPAVEKSMCSRKRVLVLATPLALKDEKFINLVDKVDKGHIVDVLPAPELVEFAEKFIFDEEIIARYFKEKLSSYCMEQYGTVVLGCTHFPLFKGILRKLLSEDIDIIDGSVGTINRLKSILQEYGISATSQESGEVTFYESGIKITDDKKIAKLMAVMEIV